MAVLDGLDRPRVVLCRIGLLQVLQVLQRSQEFPHILIEQRKN